MARCKVCSLPQEVLEGANQRLTSGLPASDVKAWLQVQGYETSYHSLSNHRRSHLVNKVAFQEPETSPEASQLSTDITQLSSLAAQQWIILTMLSQADRLQAMASATESLRVERLLSEHLFRCHQALTEVSYE